MRKMGETSIRRSTSQWSGWFPPDSGTQVSPDQTPWRIRPSQFLSDSHHPPESRRGEHLVLRLSPYRPRWLVVRHVLHSISKWWHGPLWFWPLAEQPLIPRLESKLLRGSLGNVKPLQHKPVQMASRMLRLAQWRPLPEWGLLRFRRCPRSGGLLLSLQPPIRTVL